MALVIWFLCIPGDMDLAFVDWVGLGDTCLYLKNEPVKRAPFAFLFFLCLHLDLSNKYRYFKNTCQSATVGKHHMIVFSINHQLFSRSFRPGAT